jgi:hypothetical protein
MLPEIVANLQPCSAVTVRLRYAHWKTVTGIGCTSVAQGPAPGPGSVVLIEKNRQ